MKLKEYLEWQNIKPYLWARDVGLPVSGVYAWLQGQTPTLQNILKIAKSTNGKVQPEDWVNGDQT